MLKEFIAFAVAHLVEMFAVKGVNLFTNLTAKTNGVGSRLQKVSLLSPTNMESQKLIVVVLEGDDCVRNIV
jgi:hypothetical protein